MGICQDRVVIVTGAGRGLGREHALELARQGAKVVVNDLGTEVDGTGTSSGPAQDVVDLIRGQGGEAVVNGDDVSDWEGARRLVHQAIEEFGALHAVVNNAGFLRDRMLVNMTPEEWDAVITVHLRGMFAPTRHAVDYWRANSKAQTPVPHPRLINTTSPTGLYGMVGQTNYGAAKAGVAQFTLIAAEELARLGVTVNAINPGAATRMTAKLNRPEPVEGEFDARDPANVSPLVAWLASELSADVTGQVFNIRGGSVSVAQSWMRGPGREVDRRWEAEELTDVIPQILHEAAERKAAYLRDSAGGN